MIRTANKKWFPVDAGPGPHSASTERGAILYVISAHPGIATSDLLDLLKLDTRKRAPSRLAELERAGKIRSEYIADLFK